LLSQDLYLLEGLQSVDKIKMYAKANLVGIEAAVLIIAHFSISRVWLENAYSCHRIVFWGFWPSKWGAM